jgi:hypothetical protein
LVITCSRCCTISYREYIQARHIAPSYLPVQTQPLPPPPEPAHVPHRHETQAVHVPRQLPRQRIQRSILHLLAWTMNHVSRMQVTHWSSLFISSILPCPRTECISQQNTTGKCSMSMIISYDVTKRSTVALAFGAVNMRRIHSLTSYLVVRHHIGVCYLSLP